MPAGPPSSSISSSSPSSSSPSSSSSAAFSSTPPSAASAVPHPSTSASPPSRFSPPSLVLSSVEPTGTAVSPSSPSTSPPPLTPTAPIGARPHSPSAPSSLASTHSDARNMAASDSEGRRDEASDFSLVRKDVIENSSMSPSPVGDDANIHNISVTQRPELVAEEPKVQPKSHSDSSREQHTPVELEPSADSISKPTSRSNPTSSSQRVPSSPSVHRSASPAPRSVTPPAGLVRPAIYSGVNVYEQVCNDVPVMRRAKDAFINATQILRAAGLPKTQRTKILEKDVCTGRHEKIQGGYHMFQGTWIPLESAIKLARRHGLSEALGPLFEYAPTDVSSSVFADILAERKAQKSSTTISNARLNRSSPGPRASPKPYKPPRAVSSSSDSKGDDLDDDEDLDDANETNQIHAYHEPHPDRTREPRKPRMGSHSSLRRSVTPQPAESSTAESHVRGASHLRDVYTAADGADPLSERLPARTQQRVPNSDQGSTEPLPQARRVGRPPGSGRPPGRPPGRPRKQGGQGSMSPTPVARRGGSVPPSFGAGAAQSSPKKSRLSTNMTRATSVDRLASGDEIMELDTVELMDPYHLLDPTASSDDEPPYSSVAPGSSSVIGRGVRIGTRRTNFSPSRRTHPPRLIPQRLSGDDSASCSDIGPEDSLDSMNEEDDFDPSSRVVSAVFPFMAKVSRSVPSSSSSATGGLSPSISMSGKMFARSSSYHPYRKSLGLPSSSRKSLHSRHQDFCAGCGVFTTPLWRRDSSGRRTLCNSCGLKWCFGMSGPWDASMGLLGGIAPGSALPSSNQRMNPGNASSTFLSKPFPSSPSTLPQDAHNGGKRQLMSDAASSSTAAIDLDGSSLDRSPASSSKLGGVRPNIPTADEEGNGEHQLRRLMEAVRREDAAADRAFRRAVVRFRRVRSLSSNAPTTTALQSSYLLDRGQPQADAAAPALRSVRRFSNDGGDDLEEMDAWSEDEQWGRESVMSFIHAVRGRREMPPE